jgi:hypothetical protein
MSKTEFWTVKDAEDNFVRLLETARTSGPQRIRADKGVFVLKIEDDLTKEDAAEFLLQRRPKG